MKSFSVFSDQSLSRGSQGHDNGIIDAAPEKISKGINHSLFLYFSILCSSTNNGISISRLCTHLLLTAARRKMRFLNRKLPGGRFRGEQEETIAKDLPLKPARRKANRASTQDLAERVPSDSKDEWVQRHQSSDDSVPKERGRAKSGSGRRQISQEKIQKTKTRKKTKVPAGRKKNARSSTRVVKRASRRAQSASPERGDGKICQRSESVPPQKRRQKASEENVHPRAHQVKS
jgi:hypothetical protein